MFSDSYNIMDFAVRLFIELNEGTYTDNISLSKFWKILDYTKKIGKKQVKRIDLELVYKKLIANTGFMDFDLFWTAILYLVQKFDDDPLKVLSEKLDKFFKEVFK